MDMNAEKLDLMITDTVSDITLMPLTAELASKNEVFGGLAGVERVLR